MLTEIKPGAVLFVNNVTDMAEFYRQLASMTVVQADSDHVVLEIEGLQLTIHALRSEPNSNLIDPQDLQIREDSYWKLCFPVGSILEAREKALRLGGLIKPPESEWEARGFRACDGHDPEGNVIQIREQSRS